jgi:hypothetical protein
MLIDWIPGERRPKERPRAVEPAVTYDGWFGNADSVLLSLAQETGLTHDRSEAAHFLALRFDPPDAPLAAAAVHTAVSRRLTIHGARSVSLTCASDDETEPWSVKFRFDSPLAWAAQFRSQVLGLGDQILAVVFAGPADFSEGCVTWAGAVSLD